MPVLDFEDTFGNDPCIDVDILNKRDFISFFSSGVNVFRITKDGYMYTTSGWKYRYINLGIGDIAADSDTYAYPLLKSPVPVTITNIEVGVDTTVAADAANYQTINVYNSSSSTAAATAMSTAAGFTLKVPVAFSGISSTLGCLAAGDTFYMTFTKTLTGMALSGVVVAISFTIDIPEAQSGTATDNLMRIIGGLAGTDGLIESDHMQRDHLRIKRNSETVMKIDVNGLIMPGETYTPPDQYYYQVANVGTIIDADGAAKKSALFKPNTTVRIEKIYYGVIDTLLADDDTNFNQILIKDGSGNVLVDAYANGPTTESTLTQGLLYDMGEINEAYNEITSSEQIQAEYVCNGTAADVPGLTFCVVYRVVL